MGSSPRPRPRPRLRPRLAARRGAVFRAAKPLAAMAPRSSLCCASGRILSMPLGRRPRLASRPRRLQHGCRCRRRPSDRRPFQWLRGTYSPPPATTRSPPAARSTRSPSAPLRRRIWLRGAPSLRSRRVLCPEAGGRGPSPRGPPRLPPRARGGRRQARGGRRQARRRARPRRRSFSNSTPYKRATRPAAPPAGAARWPLASRLSRSQRLWLTATLAPQQPATRRRCLCRGVCESGTGGQIRTSL
mmetsp:Transcript_4882/g.14111  ORF Transcript_4882/g.14111 Transcript_4882/m.14111 type:complete len:245 (+) Transcript_4882:352-1086(+)